LEGAKQLTDTLILTCVPPFDFGLTFSLFSGGDRQIRRFEGGKFWQVVRTRDKLALVTMKASGTVEDPEVSLELQSNCKLNNCDRQRIRQSVSFLVDADFDLRPFYTDIIKEQVLGEIVSRLRGLKIPSSATVFEALIDSIVEQQISLNVAHVLQISLIKKFGDRLNLGSNVYFAYPTPQKLASRTIRELRGCGLSLKKSEYVKDVSRRVAEGELNLEAFKQYKDVEEIISELDEVRGIGRWTAELTIVRGMRRYEVIPADDLGLRRVIAHFYCNDKKITGEQAREISEKWGKWRGIASFYLITAEVTEKQESTRRRTSLCLT
jgi:DNA-3-methyladenine glycosylase II